MDEKDQFYPAVITSLAEVEARIKRKAEAIRRLNSLLQSHPHHVPAVIFLARFLSENVKEGGKVKTDKVTGRSRQGGTTSTKFVAAIAPMCGLYE